MPTVHKSLPAERTGTPASSELLERRTKFVATEIDPALGVAAGDADFAGVPCRTIRAGDRATILYLHGGGYRMGSPEAYNAYAAALAVGAEATVVLPRYRLAPENPFPAGLDDCVAALRWLAAHPAAAGADPRRLAVGGDSAGGNLAAATVQSVADEIDLAFQLLIYPVTDFLETSASRLSLADGFLLTHVGIKQALGRYLPDESQRTDPRADVARGPISAKTPPTLVVTAGFDPLRDEGAAYAERLRQAEVKTELREYDDMVHGFIHLVSAGQRGPRYNREIATALKNALAD
jgi:acetyl esterase/lipase